MLRESRDSCTIRDMNNNETTTTAPTDFIAEAEREYADRFAPVATLTDAHAQWHAVHGALTVCPLDCGAGEAADMAYYYEQETAPRVRCGYCKRLETIAEVRECAAAAHAQRGLG